MRWIQLLCGHRLLLLCCAHCLLACVTLIISEARRYDRHWIVSRIDTGRPTNMITMVNGGTIRTAVCDVLFIPVRTYVRRVLKFVTCMPHGSRLSWKIHIRPVIGSKSQVGWFEERNQAVGQITKTSEGMYLSRFRDQVWIECKRTSLVIISFPTPMASAYSSSSTFKCRSVIIQAIGMYTALHNYRA